MRSPWRASRWITPAMAMAVAIAVVAIVLNGRVIPRVYALRAVNQYPLVTLAGRTIVCEGPITSPAGFSAVGIDGRAAGGPAMLRITVRASPRGRALATGTTPAATVPQETQVRLHPDGPGERALTVCVQAPVGHYELFGSAAPRAAVRIAGRRDQYSLLLLGQRRSLLVELPTIVRRAAQFRLGWVGPWTFWLLGAGLIACFGLAAIAIGRVLAADPSSRDEPPTRA